MTGTDGTGGRSGGVPVARAVVCLAVVCLAAVCPAAGALVGGPGAGPALAADAAGDVTSGPTAGVGPERHDVRGSPQADAGRSAIAVQEEDEEEEEEDEREDDEDDAPAVLGGWWGLDVDDDAPFLGLVQLGTVVLVVGAGGYALNKRHPFVPIRYRRYTLQVHEWLMLTGTALVAPHFAFADDLEGLGLFLGLLLGIEVLSGFYGRHLHRRVIRMSRGDEAPALVGRVLRTTNERMLSRWRRIHVALVSITALALLVHIVSVA